MTGSTLFSSKNHFPKLIFSGVLFLFIPVLLIVIHVVHQTNGILIYPYDDTFIHLTIADNLLKGNWGINENEFASASSSILYTLILAVFRMASKSELVPFIVNCLAGVSIVLALHSWLRKHLINYFQQGAILFLAIFLTPLPLMIVSGMEHALQCLFSFLFIFHFSDWLEQSNLSGQRRLPGKILLFAVLTSTIRYEGLFLIAIACILLFAYRKFFTAVVLASAAGLPLLLFGWISISKGNYFLPNSVLVKSGSFNHTGPIQMVADIFFDRLTYARNGMAALATQRLVIILPLIYLLLKKYLRPSYFFILVFLLGATLLQLSFASTGYLYRYEAYLFFCSMVILPLIFFNYRKQLSAYVGSPVSKVAGLIVAFFLFFPVVLRSITALQKTSQACINIYDQQYQMAVFIRTHYNQNTVALNDIGAVGYFTNAKIIDLWGLANIDVTKARKHHYWSANFLDSICKVNQVKLAIIYDSWFPDNLPKRWCKAATWQIQNNVICGDSVVSFYCLDASLKSMLLQQLKDFHSKLPPSIGVRYY